MSLMYVVFVCDPAAVVLHGVGESCAAARNIAIEHNDGQPLKWVESPVPAHEHEASLRRWEAEGRLFYMWYEVHEVVARSE